MDRASSSFVKSPHFERTDPIKLLDLPSENIGTIISFIDKSDNQTISHLAQTCKQLWEAAGADALVSFFYTAKERFDQADNSKKIAIFSLLAEWLTAASDRIPQESLPNIIESLSSMADLRSSDKSELIQLIKACSTINSTANSFIGNASARIDRNTPTPEGLLSQLANMSLAVNRMLGFYTSHIERLTALVHAESSYAFDVVKNL